jgi:DNA-binding FadR family transcriptional regulator
MATAYERVAGRIQSLILAGDLVAGSRLPDEDNLAEQHGVGRSTIREALRVLSGRGWLHTTRGPGGGVFVSTPSAQFVGRELGADLAFLVGGAEITFDEMREAREVHEIMAVQLAAQRAGPAERRRIREFAELGAAAVDDSDEFNRLNIEFHLAISEATHNRVLMLWMSAIRQVVSGAMAAATATREHRVHVANQHARIARLIATSDPEGAAAAMTQHLRDFEADYLELTDQRIGSESA